MTRVALLGTGAMGSRLAQNLLHAQHELMVYNRTVDRLKPLLDQGVSHAATPKTAAEQADIVICMVTDDKSSRQIWLAPETGAAHGLSQDTIAIECSTLTVAWTQELAGVIRSRGADFLDAPVVGSRPQAEAGKLIALVGGEAATLARAEAVLLSAGVGTIHPVGKTGQGMAMKLAVNALFGIQVAALAEAVTLLNRSGIPLEDAMTLLGSLPILSPAAKLAGSLMISGNHAPLFPIELVEKDFRYVLETAQAGNTEMPVSQVTCEVYQRAIAAGFGSDNITGIIQLLA